MRAHLVRQLDRHCTDKRLQREAVLQVEEMERESGGQRGHMARSISAVHLAVGADKG